MKHNISTAEAATLLVILERMVEVSKKSMVVATLIGIDRHELNKVKALIKRIGTIQKNNEYYGKSNVDKKAVFGANRKEKKGERA